MGRLALYMGLNEVKVFTPIPLSEIVTNFSWSGQYSACSQNLQGRKSPMEWVLPSSASRCVFRSASSPSASHGHMFLYELYSPPALVRD